MMKDGPIQSHEENMNGGVELTASQYHFDGRVLSSYEVHNNPGTPYTNFPTLTKYVFDKVGRVKGIAKKLNTTATSFTSSTSVPGSQEDIQGYKQLAAYKYNELGRRTTKILSPDFNSGQGLETIIYDYNMRGWLTGINKAYALNNSASSQWDHYFGLYIGYDNRDGNFAAAQLNGQITGVQWKSQGDNIQRKYDYQYDAANRLTKADFKQFDGGAWSNATMNFSVRGFDSDNNYGLKYDENGNLQGMVQEGYKLGNTGSNPVDALRYNYLAHSNRLAKVTDDVTDPNTKLGDFKDGTNTTTDDYTYDVNGNTINDLNRNIGADGVATQGVAYNYMNLPELINLPGKGTIKYLYAASGAKLQKIVTDATQNKVVTTTYMGAFIYESITVNGTAGTVELQSIVHEEGRIRVITPYSNASDPANFIGGGIPLPGGKQGVFDYFIKDHLSNIRATITEEINKASSVLTMETADAARKQYEEALFGNPGTTNEVATTRVGRSDWGMDWTLNTSQQASKLQATGGTTKVGPNVLLKVMAGDKISARVDYFYKVNPNDGGGSNGLNALLQSLLQALSGGKASPAAKDGAIGIGNNLGGTVPLQDLYNSQPTSGITTAPKAYLNYIFFDEQMKYVGQTSGFKRVETAGDVGANLLMPELKAPKNGYVYVYLSNESAEPVYFDNFAVSHQKSALIAEDHYYPYGLRIASISAKALASTLNPNAVSYGYQGSFAEELNDFDLGYNEFMLRTYDPQIGRWTGADPFDEFASPYVGMGNDPISRVDPTGGFTGMMAGMTALGRAAFFTGAGAIVGGIVGGIAGDGLKGMAIGATIGLGASFAGGMSTLQMATTMGASFAVGLVSAQAPFSTSLLAMQFIGNIINPPITVHTNVGTYTVYRPTLGSMTHEDIMKELNKRNPFKKVGRFRGSILKRAFLTIVLTLTPMPNTPRCCTNDVCGSGIKSCDWRKILNIKNGSQPLEIYTDNPSQLPDWYIQEVYERILEGRSTENDKTLLPEVNRRLGRQGEPKLSPKYKPPTNPPQLPPDELPTGLELRVMRPTLSYPNGYWVLEKPMPQGGSQKINPRTMKPGPEWDTHIPLPANYY